MLTKGFFSLQTLVLLTDGNTAVNSERLDLASWDLRARKARIVAISVGTSINEKQLKNVVSLPVSENVFYAANYDDLQKNVVEITKMSCKAGIKLQQGVYIENTFKTSK